MELTKITKELLAQGWTKEQTPEGFRPWNDFYGGWEYKRSTYCKFVFETPCGMLIMGDKVISDMAYMGVHWMVENDNPVINCPYYGLAHCPVRHQLLQDKYLYNYISRCGSYKHCAVHRTDKPWVYENSVERVLDDNQREEDALWEIFKARHKGRACKHQSHYDRSEKKWHIHYDPNVCTHYNCSYCAILDKPVYEKTKQIPLSSAPHPVSEIVYSRSDYDGHRWWTTWFDCVDQKPEWELIQEVDGFHNALFDKLEFKTLDTMEKFCRFAEPTADPTEFNFYSKTEHYYIWLRLITRSKDYNLYVHYYMK